nr:phage tail length tape measure family protein [Pseudomonas sp.]
MATNERKIQLGVEVDASKARQGFNEVKQSAADMAQSVAAQGNKAGKAIDNIGSGGAASSQKVETATRSMIQSIQRTTAAMEAGSRSSAQYYETLANQRGISTDALRPYLAQLEAVEAKQKGASGALASGAVQMDRYGMSAKATAAAMRGVPAQLTDIMVSLQGGQRPMTVLMQQGGQLKDMFGGIVPAARALGTAVLGMINPFTLAASAAGALYMAYRTGAAESEEFNRTLITTGNAIGLTTEQLNGMAQRIDGVVGTQRNAAAALNEFARSIKISSGNLEDFAATAIRWEQATGQAVAETVKQFEELGKAPLQASLKLNESMNYLTDSIY